MYRSTGTSGPGRCTLVGILRTSYGRIPVGIPDRVTPGPRQLPSSKEFRARIPGYPGKGTFVRVKLRKCPGTEWHCDCMCTPGYPTPGTGFAAGQMTCTRGTGNVVRGLLSSILFINISTRFLPPGTIAHANSTVQHYLTLHDFK
eukprot:1497049-Rhodomonas_salina.2